MIDLNFQVSPPPRQAGIHLTESGDLALASERAAPAATAVSVGVNGIGRDRVAGKHRVYVTPRPVKDGTVDWMAIGFLTFEQVTEEGKRSAAF